MSADDYQTEAGRRAVLVLEAGNGIGTVAGDHSGTETCCQVIARLGDSGAYTGEMRADEDSSLETVARTAVTRLRAGQGWLLVSGDHTGSETCVDTIVRLTSP